MHHFIYKTTNKTNGKFYIGKHSTKNINDGYLGSGLILKKAILKYGAENFTREIICFENSVEELNEKERQLITLDKIQDLNCYNLATGGKGGMMLKHITAKELSQRAAKTLKANPTKLKARNAKISVRQKTFVQNNPEAVKAKVKLMNATCRGATKENNVGIQKQVANRRVKHLAKMNSIMADMQLLDWQTMKQKELASKLHTSVPTAQRMIAMLKKGQTYWALT